MPKLRPTDKYVDVDDDQQIYGIIKDLTSHEHKNWQQLLVSAQSFDKIARRKYAWVWPTEEELMQLKSKLCHLNIKCILSIGCGNGLLEWIFKQSMDCEVYGLEVDKAWWQSSYSVVNFIDLNFVEDDTGGCFLQKSAGRRDWQFALLFCYFNNREAFLNYLHVYEGQWIIIIGPQSTYNLGIHTNPMPLDLSDSPLFEIVIELPLASHDVVIIYKRKKHK